MSTFDWSDKSVLVTGGAGFLGRVVVQKLRARGATRIHVPRRASCDLTRESHVERLLAECRPDVVLHLAAEVGGIGANRANPGRYFFANMAMGLHLIEASRRRGVEKFVQVGTICAYPKHTPVPFREDALWDGYPEETNAPYGVAKKALLVMLQAYRQQYGANGIYLLPVNLYGPGDNFDPNTSHVIPALIRKVEDARRSGSDEIVVWGSGRASREFLYVDDCAEGIVLAAERYESPEPVNLGTGSEISIQELVTTICEACEWHGRIVWALEKPDGQPRRCLDTTRARESFGFEAKVALRDGLRRTVDWWRAQCAAPASR
ncbi:MAG: GDP-L-fucose synthase [Planctomycetes bacterium]|nr:GDP-L-fucose synthase [Planctomycetota bacterium]